MTDKKSLTVSIFLKFFNELKPHGVMEFLNTVYGDLLNSEPLKGHSVTLTIDLEKLPDNHAELARKCALLKRNCMAGLFVKFFDLGAKSSGERAVIHYRPDETMYIQALPDRVTVIFSTMFKEADDMMIGKVFMQEFTESRRRLDRSPQVIYSYRVPPAELQGTGAVVNDSMAYVTFVLHPRHLVTGNTREKTIDLIQTVRTYLHYHINCSKAYIQMRMRAKTVEFLKVINRAQVTATVLPVVNTAPTGDASLAGATNASSATKLAATGVAAMQRNSRIGSSTTQKQQHSG